MADEPAPEQALTLWERWQIAQEGRVPSARYLLVATLDTVLERFQAQVETLKAQGVAFPTRTQGQEQDHGR